MSTSVFPTIPGVGYPWQRTPTFMTRRQRSISGKETRIADWSLPIYTWQLPINFLRQGVAPPSGSFTEYATVEGFFESLLGGWDSFLYTDAFDNKVTGQGIGTADGSTVDFQMVRAFGGNAAPVLAPNLTATLNVYVGGTLQSSAGYQVTPWGTTLSVGPGVLVFSTAPSTGVITADFSYYFPVRFDDDKMDFETFMSNLAQIRKMSFSSIK